MGTDIREALDMLSNILTIGIFAIFVIIVILMVIGMVITSKATKRFSKESSLDELNKQMKKAAMIDKITDVLLKITKVSIVVAFVIKLLI